MCHVGHVWKCERCAFNVEIYCVARCVDGLGVWDLDATWALGVPYGQLSQNREADPPSHHHDLGDACSARRLGKCACGSLGHAEVLRLQLQGGSVQRTWRTVVA